MTRRYRKLVLRELTGDFRSATAVVEAESERPGPGQVLVRNHWAGVNGVFDQNLCANRIRYVDVRPPFDLGIEAVGEVVELGPGVDWLRVGEAVATSKLGARGPRTDRRDEERRDDRGVGRGRRSRPHPRAAG